MCKQLVHTYQVQVYIIKADDSSITLRGLIVTRSTYLHRVDVVQCEGLGDSVRLREHSKLQRILIIVSNTRLNLKASF